MYTLTSNPRRVIVRPNTMMHSIYPTAHGRLLPSKPWFYHGIPKEDHNENEVEKLGLPPRYRPEPAYQLVDSPSNYNMYLLHYSGKQQFYGPIEKLTVVLIGNQEVPDVTRYASSVTSIEFSGHLSFTGPAFNLIVQLPLVTKVTFLIGKSQLPIFREVDDFESNGAYSPTPVCPNVESLEIAMDLQCYYERPWYCYRSCANCGNHCKDMIKATFDSLVESILNRSKQSFPNLKSFITDLPDSDIYFGGISSVIESSQFLTNNIWINALEGSIPDGSLKEAQHTGHGRIGLNKSGSSKESIEMTFDVPGDQEDHMASIQTSQSDSPDAVDVVSVVTSCSTLSDTFSHFPTDK